MYRHILVPLDVSPADDTILAHIRGLARLCGARLTFLHVADGYAARNQPRLAESEEMLRDQAYLEGVRAAFAAEGFAAEAILECGEPADEIIRAARERGVDLIAMSTHGHRGLADLLLGSTVTRVRHAVSVPILLLRAADARTEAGPR